MNAQAELHGLDQFGPLLNAREMASIWRLSVKQFYHRASGGHFDRFRVQPAIGPRCYSKTLVLRYLAGEPIDQQARVFGRKRA